MNDAPQGPQTRLNLIAEFDLVADEYDQQHRANISISGENPEYFSEYKVRDFGDVVRSQSVNARNLLDFGSDIHSSGSTFPARAYLARTYLPEAWNW